VVNDSAAEVATTSVVLTLSAVDTGGSGLSRMRFSNDDLAWSIWEVYSASKNWTLGSGDGTKTVYAQFSDSVGNESVTYTDSILLDTTRPTGSVAIDAGASGTTTTTVTLALAGSDTGSGVSHIRLSNDNLAWSPWQPYGSTASWVLSAGEGRKTVYVQFRDAAGNVSYSPYDEIVFSSGGTATLAFQWNGEGYADLHVENAQGAIIANTSVSGYGEELSWYVDVPAGQVYRMVCDYYDDWYFENNGYGTGIYTDNTLINADGILSPGETVTWQY